MGQCVRVHICWLEGTELSPAGQTYLSRYLQGEAMKVEESQVSAPETSLRPGFLGFLLRPPSRSRCGRGGVYLMCRDTGLRRFALRNTSCMALRLGARRGWGVGGRALEKRRQPSVDIERHETKIGGVPFFKGTCPGSRYLQGRRSASLGTLLCRLYAHLICP